LPARYPASVALARDEAEVLALRGHQGEQVSYLEAPRQVWRQELCQAQRVASADAALSRVRRPQARPALEQQSVPQDGPGAALWMRVPAAPLVELGVLQAPLPAALRVSRVRQQVSRPPVAEPPRAQAAPPVWGRQRQTAALVAEPEMALQEAVAAPPASAAPPWPLLPCPSYLSRPAMPQLLPPRPNHGNTCEPSLLRLSRLNWSEFSFPLRQASRGSQSLP
jgi:hypothetical protein